MKYLVVIEEKSPTGQVLASQSHPVKAGDDRHVGLFCKEVDASHPHYIHVRTIPTTPDAVPLSHYLPHDSVVLVCQYDEPDDLADQPPRLPVGFLPG